MCFPINACTVAGCIALGDMKWSFCLIQGLFQCLGPLSHFHNKLKINKLFNLKKNTTNSYHAHIFLKSVCFNII